MISNLKGANYVWRNSVTVATTGSNVNTAALVGSVIDGHTVTATDIVLVKDQNTASQNGIYINNTIAPEYDSGQNVTPYGIYYIQKGTLNGGKFYTANAVGQLFSNSGVVSSVGLTMPSIFSVSGSPVTGSGSFAVTLASEAANSIFAAPSGSSGTPSFRSLVVADLPTGIPNANLQNSAISVAVGSSGTGLNVSGSPVSLGGTITINLPDASATADGTVNTGAQTFAGSKTFTSAPTFSSLTANSVLFAGSGGLVSQDNTNFSWTDSTQTANIGGNINTLSISDSPSTYLTGTISATVSTTITGSGTTFTAAMVGGLLSSGSTNVIITAFTSATSITVESAVTLSSAAYVIYYGGTQLSRTSLSTAALRLQGAVYDNTGTAGSSGQVLSSTGSKTQWISAAAGTVTSVGLSLPGIFTVSGSPVTSSGTLTAVLASESANSIFAGPNGSAGTPTFRAMAVADLPTNIPNANLANSSISVAVGSSGTGFNVSGSPVSLGGTVTLNLPDASATADGTVNTGTQTFAGSKTFSSAPTFSSLTANSVLFAGSGGLVSQDNTNFSWNDTTLTHNVGGNINTLSISDSPSTYSTGTVSATASTTITGSGTTFTAAMIGGLLSSGSTNVIITTFTSVTSITVESAVTLSSATYVIYYGGTQLSRTFLSTSALRLQGAVYDNTGAAGTSGQVLSSTGSKTQWITPVAGTVTSVGLSLPGIFSVSGSPVTSSGTLTATLTSESANSIFAGPNGSSGTPTFRALVAADIPALSYVTSVGLSLPSIFTVTVSPITSSGTLTATLASETANYIFAAPDMAAGTPTFRAMLVDDLPTGIPNANLANSSISVAVGTSGTSFNVSGSPVSLGGTVTLNLPAASGSATGTVTTGSQSFAGTKNFQNAPTLGGFTQNSILYIGSGGLISQDNLNFNWNDSTLIQNVEGNVAAVALTTSLNFYSGGTISAIASTTVIGSGTSWTSAMVGGLLSNNGTNVIVTAVVSSTQLTVETAITTVPSYTLYYNGTQSSRYSLSTAILRLQGAVYDNTGAAGTSGQVLSSTGTKTQWITPAAGTVTSVGLSLPGIFSVSGSPVTSSGTLTATLTSETANYVFAAPNGSSGTPTFRAMVVADLPTNIPNANLANSSITVVVGSSGTGFNVSGSPVSLGGTITINLPDASATADGTVNTGAQTFAGAKTLTSAPTVSVFTAGSVLFAGTGGLLSQNNNNLFWNNTSGYLGIGTSAAPTEPLDVVGNAVIRNSGNTAQMTVMPGWNSGTGTWINLDISGPSGIGTGGAGVDPWLAYASMGEDWFSNSNGGDLCYRNTMGRMLFGISTGTFDMAIATANTNRCVAIGTASPTNTLTVGGYAALPGVVNGASSYSTGTITGSGTTITGSGTTFTSSMVGGVITAANGYTVFVTAYTSATSLTVSTSQTIASTAYTLTYDGHCHDNSGNCSVNNIYIGAAVYDYTNSSGSSGQILVSNGGNVQWVYPSAITFVGTYYFTSSTATSCANAATTSIMGGVNYSVYGTDNGQGTRTALPSGLFALSSATGGYGILYTGPSGLLAQVSYDLETITTSVSVSTVGLLIASATSTTGSFTNNNYVTYTSINTTFTGGAAIQRFGYITLENGYKYAVCVYNNSGAAVTATVAATSKFIIQIL